MLGFAYNSQLFNHITVHGSTEVLGLHSTAEAG